jgi:hypothetical protein
MITKLSKFLTFFLDNFELFYSLQVYNRAKVHCELRGEEPSPENIRSAMEPLLILIRFPSMIDEEFCRVVGLLFRIYHDSL